MRPTPTAEGAPDFRSKSCKCQCLRNKPVTYASNIWDRGYANCAGHCIVFASAMKALGVPYCVVTLSSKVKGKPKHAIMQAGVFIFGTSKGCHTVMQS